MNRFTEKSDRNTVIEELKEKLRVFVEERNWEKYHNPKNLAESICIEAAELLEIFQWRNLEETREWRFDTNMREKVSEELADVIIYSLNMANAMEIDVASAVLNKIALNEKKYPVERYFGRAHQQE